MADIMGTMAALVAEGKVRHVGVSNFGVRDLGDAVAAASVPVVSNQLPYNLLVRQIGPSSLHRRKKKERKKENKKRKIKLRKENCLEKKLPRGIDGKFFFSPPLPGLGILESAGIRDACVQHNVGVLAYSPLAQVWQTQTTTRKTRKTRKKKERKRKKERKKEKKKEEKKRRQKERKEGRKKE